MQRLVSAGRHHDLRMAEDGQAVDIVDHTAELVIDRLIDAWALRMHSLFERRARGELDDTRYNCYAAVRYVLGHTEQLVNEGDMAAQGERLDRKGGLDALPVPGVFQIHASIVEYDEDMGMYPIGSRDIVTHTGLVIGRDRRGPVAFHKFCQKQLEVTPLREILDFYFEQGLDTGAFDVTILPAAALARGA